MQLSGHIIRGPTPFLPDENQPPPTGPVPNDSAQSIVLNIAYNTTFDMLKKIIIAINLICRRLEKPCMTRPPPSHVIQQDVLIIPN